MMQLVTKYYHSELSVHRNSTLVWGEILSQAHRWLARRTVLVKLRPRLPLAGSQRGREGRFVRFLGLCHKQKFKVLYIFHRRFLNTPFPEKLKIRV